MSRTVRLASSVLLLIVVFVVFFFALPDVFCFSDEVTGLADCEQLSPLCISPVSFRMTRRSPSDQSRVDDC